MSKNNTVRHRLFANYYLGAAGFNATVAAEMAGYKAKTRHNLQVLASQILHRPEVQAMLNEKVQEVEMTTSEVLAELADLARWDYKAEENQPRLFGIEASAHAKMFDTMMRAKLKSLSDLLRINAGSIKDQVEKIKAAFEQHQVQHPEVSDTERAEMFKEHVDPTLVEQVLTDLMKRAENRRRLSEAEIDADNPMLVAGEM